LDHNPSGYEDGLSGKRDPDTLEHHPQENNEVSVLADQGENVVYGLQGLMILLTYQTVRVKESGLPLFIVLPLRGLLGNSYTGSWIFIQKCTPNGSPRPISGLSLNPTCWGSE
jgi:hypothetical protein